MKALAFSDRGGAIFELPGNVGLCTTFSFNHFYPATIRVMRAFLKNLLLDFQHSKTQKQDYFEWMMVMGEIGRFALDKLANTKGLADVKIENPEAKRLREPEPFKPSTPRAPRCLLETPPRTANEPLALQMSRRPTTVGSQAFASTVGSSLAFGSTFSSVGRTPRPPATPPTAKTARLDREEALLQRSVARTSTALPRLKRRNEFRRDVSTPQAKPYCRSKTWRARAALDKDPETRIPNPYQSPPEVKRRAEIKERRKWLYGPYKFTDASNFDPLDSTQTLNDPYAKKPPVPDPYLSEYDVARGDVILNRQAWLYGPFKYT